MRSLKSSTSEPKRADWRNRMHRASGTVAALVLALLAAMPVASAGEQPYGVQLRERLDELDRWCRKEKLGPYVEDPKNRRYTDCDLVFLKDKHWDPNATEESRYAHSIKLPPPHDKPQVEYRPGMISKQFFDELCAKEAGEWVFSGAEDVEGVYIARSAQTVPPAYSLLLYDLLEPLLTLGSKPQDRLVQPPHGKFKFVEIQVNAGKPPRSPGAFARFVRDDSSPSGRWQTAEGTRFMVVPYVVRKDSGNEPQSRHLVIARGILRPHFREHAISGSELIIVDAEKGLAMALLRTFFITLPPDPSAPFTAPPLIRGCTDPGRASNPAAFVYRTLKPTP